MRVCVFTLLFLLGTVSADGVALKKDHSVTEKYLKLSDFFDGVPEDKDQDLVPSPSLGETKHYPHAWVRRLAKNFSLSWTPDGHKGISFYRDGVEIPHKAIAESIQQHALSEEIDGNDQINISYPSAPIVTTPENVKFVIAEFKKTGDKSFSATIHLLGNNQSRIVRGTIEKVQEMPVLKNAMQVGGIIRSSDIDVISVPVKKVSGQHIRSPELLIGKTVRSYSLKSGELIRSADIAEPVAVKKGTSVQIKIEGNGFEITTKGRALASGGIGETIQVANVSNKKVLDGVIKDSSTVLIEGY